MGKVETMLGAETESSRDFTPSSRRLAKVQYNPDPAPPARSRSLAWSLVFLFTASSMIVVADEARADSATTMSATLPTAKLGTSVVWDGTYAYVFGGRDGGNDNQIVRYNPSTDTTTTMSATLPVSTVWASAVWDPTVTLACPAGCAYIFGSVGMGTYSDGREIVRYSPGTDTVTTMSAKLPTGRFWTSAVWSGTDAYIFGGNDVDTGLRLNKIVRYTPLTNTVVTMGTTLPTKRDGTSAVWDPTVTAACSAGCAYIFGGWGGSNNYYLNEIVRWSPAASVITTMWATLPTGRDATSAAWDGTHAYIFGGYSSGLASQRQVVLYRPSTDTAATMGATLPASSVYSSAAWNPTVTTACPVGCAYIFGGHGSSGSWQATDQIVRYVADAPPAAPQNLVATADVGQITLTWQAPSGGSAVSSYKVYRGTTSGGETLVNSGGCSSLGNVLTCTDPVGNGALRYYKVKAANAVGESPYSNEASATTPGPPSAPQSLTAMPGVGQITLTWAAPSNNGGSAVTSYNVYRGTTSGSEVLVTAGGCSSLGNVLTCTDSGLGNAATRYYKVKAVNAIGPGSYSNEASATTATTPTAPRELQASAGAGQITLTWTAPTSDGRSAITNYKVYRGTSSGSGWLLTTGGCSGLGNVLTCTDSDVTLGNVYYYKVSAVNAVGESPKSNEAWTLGS